jgi:GntR family transcriptional regulator/MocR family aminotransferase
MDYQLLLERFIRTHEYHHEQTGWSAQRRLHECLRGAIRHGSLPAGTRLLASRVLAQELKVARNTVVYAYEQLATEGYLRTDRRGSFVTSITSDQGTRSLASVTSKPGTGLSHRAQSLLPFPVAAELSGGFAPGVPSLADFPVTLWRRLLDRTWRALATAQLSYAGAAGELPLRAAIADHLRASRGADCDASQIFITEGTQSSLDLCARAFADANDKVWLENPGYSGAHTAFRTAQLKIIGIKVDADGIAPNASDWLRHTPKLIYVTPSHQYPTGSILGLARRIALIKDATAHGALIIEDDYDSEFRHDGPPLAAMQGLLPDAPVLYLGTFSKTMFPALRIGYIVVPKHLVIAFTALVAKSTLRGRAADQLCLAEFIRGGHFGLHLRRMRRLYCQRRDVLVAELALHLGDFVSIHGDSAGMHLALRFESASLNDVSDVSVSEAVLAQGIVAPALSAHSVGSREHGWRGLMLGYAQVPVEQIAPLVKKLAVIVRQATQQHRK